MCGSMVGLSQRSYVNGRGQGAEAGDTPDQEGTGCCTTDWSWLGAHCWVIGFCFVVIGGGGWGRGMPTAFHGSR